MQIIAVLFFLVFAFFSTVSEGGVLADSLPHSVNNMGNKYIVLNKITIEGNKKTKERIILRELEFNVGDTLVTENIDNLFLKNKNRVFNTGLFVTVDFYLDTVSAIERNLLIKVKERWYTYPNLIFELADRNFNEWWQQRNRDLNRTNYGIYWDQKNVRGRNENLKVKVQLGFTKQLHFTYNMPYIDKRQKMGLGVDAAFNTNKQLAYRTLDHKLSYINVESGEYLRERFRSSISISRRSQFYQSHYLNLAINLNIISDTVAKLNPDYFLKGRTKQNYLSLRYIFINDKRDIGFYPLNGSYFRIELEKLGLTKWDDLNLILLYFAYEKFYSLGSNFYLAGALRQKISLPRVQPYFNYRGLGYGGDYVSGYELYAIDGKDFSLAKLNLKYRLITKQINLKFIPVHQFNTIPFSIYIRAFSDAGYVNDQLYNRINPRLTNKLLWGNGIGVDFVSYYDFVFRIEFSVNRMKEPGLFLHMKAPI